MITYEENIHACFWDWVLTMQLDRFDLQTLFPLFSMLEFWEFTTTPHFLFVFNYPLKVLLVQDEGV